MSVFKLHPVRRIRLLASHGRCNFVQVARQQPGVRVSHKHDAANSFVEEQLPLHRLGVVPQLIKIRASEGLYGYHAVVPFRA